MNLIRNRLCSIEYVAGLEICPVADRACLDAYHVFEAIFRLEVAHTGGLICPGVPHHNILKVVANQGKSDRASFLHDDGVRWTRGRSVDAVSLASNADGAGLRLSLGTIHLINELGLFEASNLDLGNVLDGARAC
jgi:hypothetical protein